MEENRIMLEENRYMPNLLKAMPGAFGGGIREIKYIQMRDEHPEKISAMRSYRELDEYLDEMERLYLSEYRRLWETIAPSDEELTAMLRENRFEEAERMEREKKRTCHDMAMETMLAAV